MSFWPWKENEESDDYHCTNCGEEVSKSDWFHNVDCPHCGQPCSEPF